MLRLTALIFSLGFAVSPGAGMANDLGALLDLAKDGDWEKALTAAEEAAEELDRTALDILTWQRLRAGLGTFEEALAFLQEKSDWPGLLPIRRLGERTITAQTPRADVLRYFRHRHASSAHGALHLADALSKAGRPEDAASEIILAWRRLSFSRSEQAIFQKEFAPLLRPHNFIRMDRLLWRGQVEQVERMFPFLTKDERALARARIALREKIKGVDSRIAAVPEQFKSDPGLAFERFIWRLEKGRDRGAEELILAQSENAQSLGRPEYWSSNRRTLARRAMREGRTETAYQLASNHHLTSGADFADLEWLSGYLALTEMDDPKRALQHFQRFRAGVTSPISFGRAAWWEARAYEALDRPLDAEAALEFGAEFQTGFFGLLASEKAGIAMEPEVIEVAPLPVGEPDFLQDERLRAGQMLAEAGSKRLGALFFTHLYDRLEPADQVRLGDYALEIEEPHIAVTVAKLAASRGEGLPRPYFPLVEVDASDVPAELILSIIRRESEFNPQAQSSAGARGLMQLMPGTAKEVSGDLDEPYNLGALTEDSAYNMRLGTEYLRFLMEEFDGNVLLVASAYNAGPGRTRSWLKQIGDPRSGRMDPLTWIERIPFRETRNYVMRVAESVVVYRARLAQELQEIRLSEELTGRL